jgi:hypothetical protein
VRGRTGPRLFRIKEGNRARVLNLTAEEKRAFRQIQKEASKELELGSASASVMPSFTRED